MKRVEVCLDGKHIKAFWSAFIHVFFVLILCSEELQKRNEVIRILTRHVWMIESREKQLQEQLSEAKQKLGELEKKQQDVGEKCQDYEVRRSVEQKQLLKQLKL